MNGSIDDIVIFTKVAESLSFAKAGQELNVPTSLVSRRISGLEATLGIKLLNRTTRRVSLTEEGRRLFDEVASKIEDTQKAVRELLSLKGAPQGVLKITAPVELGQYLIKYCMPGFFEAYPAISLQWDLTSEKRDPVKQGIDVIIRAGRPDTDSLIIRKLKETRFCAFKSPELKIKTKNLSSDEIANLPWAMFSNDMTGRPQRTVKYKQDGHNQKIDLKKINFQANNLSAVKYAIEQGYGVGLLPEFIFKDDIKTGKIVKVFEEYEWEPFVEFVIGYPENRYVLPKLRVFIDWLVDHFSL